MIIVMILATASRCASSAYCPDDEQLVAAIRGRDNAAVQVIMEQAARASPDDLTMVHPQRIRRVSDVFCGSLLRTDEVEDPPAINCKFKIGYWSMDTFEVARMVLRDGKWKIEDALSVTRNRRSP